MHKMKRSQREAVITQAAVTVGNALGLIMINHDSVSSKCIIKTPARTVRSYFPTKTELWIAAVKHPDASDDLKRQGGLVGIK